MTTAQSVVLLFIPLVSIAGLLAGIAFHLASVADSLRRIADHEDTTGQTGDVTP